MTVEGVSMVSMAWDFTVSEIDHVEKRIDRIDR